MSAHRPAPERTDRARRGRPRGEEGRPHRSSVSVLTTPRGAHRKPVQCARGPPRRGRAKRLSRCRRSRAAPTRWSSDPDHSTARQASISRNPAAQKPAPPGCTRRPPVMQTGEVARRPKARPSELEASTPATAAWSWEGRRYSSLGPPRPPVSRANGTPRQSRDSPVFDADMKMGCRRKRGPHPIWCSTLLSTNACLAIAPLTVGRDCVNISDKSTPLRDPDPTTNAQQSRSAASADATSRCPKYGPPRRYLGLMRVGSVKTT